MWYIDAHHSKALTPQNTVRNAFRGSFASLVWWLKTLFTQDVAVLTKSGNEFGCEASIALRGSILKM